MRTGRGDYSLTPKFRTPKYAYSFYTTHFQTLVKSTVITFCAQCIPNYLDSQ